jgi:cytochrome c5
LLPLLLILASSDLIAHYECNRCHDVGKPAPLEKHCVRCHEAIQAGTWNAPKALMDAWRPNLVSYAAVPSLDLIGFRREWVEGYLLRPHDIRPHLAGMMPRFPMKPEHARQLAAKLVPKDRDEAMPSFSEQQIAQGRRLFGELSCDSCHAYSGVTPVRSADRTHAAMLAPDLRFTRARLRPSFVRRFLADPRIRSTASMPKFDLGETEVESLTAFVLASPLSPVPEEPYPPRLPLLDRPVAFAEVKKEIFEKACQHCHANPEKSFNDGGPGNTGGFGYRGKRLSLASYREVQSGSVDERGNRRSIFVGEVPKVITHLLARREEVRGREVAGVLGMPMGLPPLSPEHIQLLESWIAQGRPE